MSETTGCPRISTIRPWRRLRRALLAGLLALPALAPAQDLPRRNLLVEWRMVSDSAVQRQGGGIETGEWRVDSHGHVTSRTGVQVLSTSRTRSGTVAQQLQVLNGGHARIFLGQSQPVMVWQFSAEGSRDASGRPQWGAWSGTVWTDTGQGMSVRPQWSGGQQVLVDIESQSSQPSRYGPEGVVETARVITTLQTSLGTWTPVARRGEQREQSRRGLLSTEDVSRDDNEVLELRVTLP